MDLSYRLGNDPSTHVLAHLLYVGKKI